MDTGLSGQPSRQREPVLLYERTAGAAAAALPKASYRRHEPEKSVLYQVVQEHLESLLADARRRTEHGFGYPLISAFGTWLEGAPVVVGRDTRPSSPMIANAAIAALSATGCEVLDAGICPTVVAMVEGRRGVYARVSQDAGEYLERRDPSVGFRR